MVIFVNKAELLEKMEVEGRDSLSEEELAFLEAPEAEEEVAEEAAEEEAEEAEEAPEEEEAEEEAAE